MDARELLKLNADFVDREICEDKRNFINNLDSLIKMLVHTKSTLIDSLGDSTNTVNLNPLGILQRQGQMIELLCMEITTKAKHLSVMRRIIAESEGE